MTYLQSFRKTFGAIQNKIDYTSTILKYSRTNFRTSKVLTVFLQKKRQKKLTSVNFVWGQYGGKAMSQTRPGKEIEKASKLLHAIYSKTTDPSFNF